MNISIVVYYNKRYKYNNNMLLVESAKILLLPSKCEIIFVTL